jgi:hypothetical protein
MRLSPTTEAALMRFHDRHRGRLRIVPRHASDFPAPQAVRLFMGLLEEGEHLDGAEVQAWFLARGWPDADARRVGDIAEAVDAEFREQGRI